ncbi:MAG: hypothetical protein V2A63_01935 [Patescibacteria group bacterium]
MNQENDPSSHKASEEFASEEPRILEGEVVGKIPEKRSPPKNSVPPQFKIFAASFAKLKRNCLFASIAFFVAIFAAIYFGNGWLVLLAFLLPPWIFSLKK